VKILIVTRYLLQVDLSKSIYQHIAMNLAPLDSSRQGAFRDVKKIIPCSFHFQKNRKKTKKKLIFLHVTFLKVALGR
jgi:hypothetical protein